MSFLHDANPSQGYMMAQLHQQELRKEFARRSRERDAVEVLTQAAKAERRFHLMYKVRHWLHRLAPRMARAML
jgi:hypothetical protein